MLDDPATIGAAAALAWLLVLWLPTARTRFQREEQEPSREEVRQVIDELMEPRGRVAALREQFLLHDSTPWLERSPDWLAYETAIFERELDIAMGLQSAARADEPLHVRKFGCRYVEDYNREVKRQAAKERERVQLHSRLCDCAACRTPREGHGRGLDWAMVDDPDDPPIFGPGHIDQLDL